MPYAILIRIGLIFSLDSVACSRLTKIESCLPVVLSFNAQQYMKYLCTLSILIGLSISFSLAQRIHTEQVGVHLHFSQQGDPLQMEELLPILETNPDAFRILQQADNLYSTANVLYGIGGGLLGMTVGFWSEEVYVHWGWGAAGLGLFLLGRPFHSQATIKARVAVDMYNGDLDQFVHLVPTYEWQIGLLEEGVGIGLRF